MPDHDEDILRRGMRTLGDDVHGDDPWDGIVRKRQRLTARRRRRTVMTALVVVFALVAGGTALYRAFFTGGGTRPGDSISPSPRPSTWEEQLQYDQGTLVDEGTLGAFGWRLFLFDDPDNLQDGVGPNIYLLFRGQVNWLDRPDPPVPIDTVRVFSRDGRAMFITGVATGEVASVELVVQGQTIQAEFIEPEGAAFSRAYWVQGSVESGLFRGTLISRDANGRVIHRQTYTGAPEP